MLEGMMERGWNCEESVTSCEESVTSREESVTSVKKVLRQIYISYIARKLVYYDVTLSSIR